MKRLLPVVLVLLAGCLEGTPSSEEPAAQPGWASLAACPMGGPLQAPEDCLRSEAVPHNEAPPRGWYCIEYFPLESHRLWLHSWLYTDGNGHYGVQYRIDPLPEGIVMGSFYIESEGAPRELVTIRVREHGFVPFQGIFEDQGSWGSDDWRLFTSHGSPSFFSAPSDVRVLEFEGSAWYTWVFRNETGMEHYRSEMIRFGSQWSPLHANLTGPDFKVSLIPDRVGGGGIDDYLDDSPLDFDCDRISIPPSKSAQG